MCNTTHDNTCTINVNKCICHVESNRGVHMVHHKEIDMLIQ